MTCAQHLLSAKSLEGVEEMIYFISQPSVKNGKRSVFKLRPLPFHDKEERTQVKNCKHFKTLREG